MKNSRFKIIAIFFILGLALPACTIQITTTVQPDGSGELRTEIGISPEDQAELLEFGSSAEEFCNQTIAEDGDFPPGATTRVEVRGEDTWCVLAIPFASLDEYTRILTDEGEGITVNQLSLTENQFIYDLTLDLTSDESGFEGEEYFPLELLWQVEMPGQVGGNNADLVQGNTLIWVLEEGTLRTLRAESSLGRVPLGGAGIPRLVIFLVAIACLCLLGLALMGGLVFWLIRRRQSS